MNTIPQTRLIFALALSLSLISTGFAQRPRRGPGGDREAALKQPFKGVIANGKLEKDLFPIQATGVSTEPILKATQAFLNELSKEQRAKTIFPIDDIEWRKWDNRHRYARQGVGFNEMNEQQRQLAFKMMGTALSAKGLKITKDIMKLNETLAELTKRPGEYGQWLYWITIMGEPSATEPWGWQLDGHHVVINYFVLGDQVVMSPVFMGSEPVKAEGGKFSGTIVMQEEQAKGIALMQSLTDKQKNLAVIQGEKGPTNNLAEAFNDNINLDYAGIAANKLNEQQQKLLLSLIAEYTDNIEPGHAKVKMEEVKKHLNETYFAWIGKTDKDAVFYYRVHSPVILIEFDHQRPIALDRSSTPTRKHIHTTVRTPNGNDYGKDLLRQHYEEHHK
ncbi:MAG: DUF3500 domain-containing protein [Pirellulales bacterium]